jgi:GxxExxY protein
MPVRFVHTSTMMNATLADAERVRERIIGCAIEVHRILGPGLLESIYRECLLTEMRRERLRVESERPVALAYKGEHINASLRLDLLVEQLVVVELKAVERLHQIHLAQVITYLKLTGYSTGLLMNFNAVTLTAGLKRLTHPDYYVKKPAI